MSFTMRLYRIDQMIQEAGLVSFETLRAALQCSAPTLKRDLRYMREQLGAPIEYSFAKNGYYYSNDSKHTSRQIEKAQDKMPAAWYSANELRVLMTVLGELDQIEADKKGLLAGDMRAMKARMLACVRSDKIAARELLKRIKVVLPEHVEASVPFFGVVGEALSRRHRLRITYFTRSRAAENAREISPLRLVNYRGHWYVDAWCHQAEGLRTFNVENIINAEILSKKCRVVAMRTVEDELDKTYGIFSGGQLQRAVIEVDALLAPYVTAEIWHRDQTMQKRADGSVVLEVPFASEVEIASRILSLGSHAKVSAPETLKKHLSEELRRMTDIYDAALQLQRGE